MEAAQAGTLLQTVWCPQQMCLGQQIRLAWLTPALICLETFFGTWLYMSVAQDTCGGTLYTGNITGRPAHKL